MGFLSLIFKKNVKHENGTELLILLKLQWFTIKIPYQYEEKTNSRNYVIFVDIWVIIRKSNCGT